MEKGREVSKTYGSNRFCVIYDREGYTKLTMDKAATKKVRTLASEIEDYYPLFLDKCYVLHTTWLFKFGWALVKYFFSSYLRNTVKLISNKDLLKYFDKDCLLEEHGGTS